MIDDRWSVDFGTWRFDRAAFPDPAAMVRRLHDRGCPVTLWLVPFVSPDSAVFRRLEPRGLLVAGPAGDTVVRRWWNGFSAILDVTNPAAVDWLTGEPILRPLAYHDPTDPGITDQFLLGADLLVAAVLEPGAAVRRCGGSGSRRVTGRARTV